MGEPIRFLRLKRGGAPKGSPYEDEVRTYADENGALRTILHDGTDAPVAGAGSLPNPTDEGDVLTVSSGEWAGEPPGESLPAGGTTGQVLTKASDADGDADWEPSGGSMPDGYALTGVLNVPISAAVGSWIAMTPDESSLYTIDVNTQSIYALDVASGEVTTLALDPFQLGDEQGVVTPDGALLLVPVFDDGTGLASALLLIDTDSFTIAETVPLVQADAQWVAVSPDGATAYVAARTTGAVTVIDLATHTVTDSYPVAPSTGPYAIQVSLDGSTLWVACDNDAGGPASLLKMNAATGAITQTIASGLTLTASLAFVLSADGSRLYMGDNQNPGSTEVYDTATGALVTTRTEAGADNQIAARGDSIYIPDTSNSRVTIVDAGSGESTGTFFTYTADDTGLPGRGIATSSKALYLASDFVLPMRRVPFYDLA